MKTQLETIEKLLKTETPFSVIQYFESFKGSKRETRKVYELLTISKQKDRVVSKILDNDSIFFIKNNKEINNIINNEDGSVWEFNDFKSYVKHSGIRTDMI